MAVLKEEESIMHPRNISEVANLGSNEPSRTSSTKVTLRDDPE